MSLAFATIPQKPTLECYLTGNLLDIAEGSLEYFAASLEAGITAASLFYSKNPARLLDSEMIEFLSEGYDPEEFQRGIWLYESQTTK